MKYEKARAEVIDFGEGNSFSMCTSYGYNTGGGYKSISEYTSQNITIDAQNLQDRGNGVVFCQVFTHVGTFSFTVNGQPMSIDIQLIDANKHLYSCPHIWG